jgi:ORF6N domain
MFQLSNTELENLISQTVTSRWGGLRKLPYAFTEHGVTMLASVLRSDRAIEINIQIVRACIATTCPWIRRAEPKDGKFYDRNQYAVQRYLPSIDRNGE